MNFDNLNNDINKRLAKMAEQVVKNIEDRTITIGNDVYICDFYSCKAFKIAEFGSPQHE